MTANQTTDAGTDQEVLVEGAGTLIAQVKAGSVTVLVRRCAPVTVQVPQKNGKDSAAGEASQKTYDSYQIVYYEGSERKILRRSTPEKARNGPGKLPSGCPAWSSSGSIGEKDRCIFVLARATARSIGLPVDGTCRRYAELRRRLKEGTLEQAVDFKNDHGKGVRDGVANRPGWRQTNPAWRPDTKSESGRSRIGWRGESSGLNGAPSDRCRCCRMRPATDGYKNSTP